MRIILDLQGCQSDSRLRGIGRYSLALAKGIAANRGEHDIWILLSDLFPDSVESIRFEFAPLLPANRIVVLALPGPASALQGFAWRARASELIREFAIAELRPDVVHISSLFEGYTSSATTSIAVLDTSPVVAVTHYDLIQHLDQETHLRDAKVRDFYHRKLDMLKSADLLLAISSYSRKEVIQHLELPSDRVENISSGVSDRFFVEMQKLDEPAEVLNRYGITKPFVMTTGIVEPRKNLEGLISAFGALDSDLRTNYQLLLVCQASPLEKVRLERLARAKGLQDSQIIITGFVPDDDLIALYRLTRLFVFPSFREGFGLPAVEAMACGAAVIGSNATSVPEAIGNTEALFDPHDIAGMATLIARGLSDSEFHNALCVHGVQYARTFSWTATALRAIGAFEVAHVRKKQALTEIPQPDFDLPKSLYNRLTDNLALIDLPSTDADWVAAASAISLAERPRRKKQMLVDVSVLCGFDAKSGIQRVTRAIAMHLINTPPPGFDVRLVRIDRTERAYQYADVFMNSFSPSSSYTSTGDGDGWVETRSGDVFLGLDLCADTVPDAQPWFEARRRQGVLIYFVVYDLLPVLRPEWFHQGIARVFPPWLATIGQVSDGVIGISHAVANDLREWYSQHPSPRLFDLKIGAFHLGADIDNSQPSVGLESDSSAVIEKINSRPSFLMVGTVEPRKGYAQALAAFDLLWKKGVDVNFAIVGGPGWHQDALITAMQSHPEMGKRMIWLQGISDEYLDHVYAASTCLLAASEGEGFGLPLIEAAQKGLPIIARELAVFKEVAGDGAFYFNGTNAESLGSAIEYWLDLFTKGAVPKSDKIKWLTWSESANALKCVLFDDNWLV